MKYLVLIFLLPVSQLAAQQLNLIPYPEKVMLTGGTVTVPANVEFTTADAGLRPLLQYLNVSSLRNGSSGKRQPVTLTISGEHEGYLLSVSSQGIHVEASNSAGIFNGLVTLLQLCKTTVNSRGQYVLPQLVIEDKPRYSWRGFMLDESRHFFGKTAVKSLLDWMAFYKLNRFHWHLTDANGWRIEIKQYPLLTSIGGKGNFTDSSAAARYYTQQDIREIVAYAKARQIMVIPEIDMPGHATSATQAYPELSGGDAPEYAGFTFNPLTILTLLSRMCLRNCCFYFRITSFILVVMKWLLALKHGKAMLL